MRFTKSSSQAFLLFLAAALAALLTYQSKQEGASDREEAANTTLAERVARDIAGNVIVDFHQQFSNSTLALLQSSQGFCANINEVNYQEVQSHWRDAMSDWQAVNLINFGPIKEDNKSWRLQFWPDKKNLVGKKIKSLLKTQKELDLKTIREASVVIQGLSGLEYLLFDAKGGQLERYENSPVGQRQCKLLLTTATLTHTIAKELSQSWQSDSEYIRSFLHPNTPMETNTGVDIEATPPLTLILESVLANLETLKNSKLGAPLGLNTARQTPNPYLVEAWRSGFSLSLIQANIEASQQILINGELLGFTDYLIANKQDQLASDIVMSLENISQQLQLVKPPLAEAISNEGDIKHLILANEELVKLIGILKREVPKALGLTLGFNDNDGD